MLAHFYVAFAAFAVGTIFGLLQTLSRASAITLGGFFDYYKLLTAHGVLLAIVFTTFFIAGISTYAVYDSMPVKSRSTNVGWIAWWVMTIGTVMAAVTILAGNASVLYTFYAPLKASPTFYIGATLLIVGSWIVFFDFLLHAKAWRVTHRGERLPLPAFMATVNFLMWFLATLGVAVEMLYLIPWSLGWTQGVDVAMTRMYFWYFGHPLVYFWILGAYLAWYGMVPKMLKVPVFSDALTRVAFIGFLLLSLPVGIHHQFSDPGIAGQWKLLQTFLTLLVVVPSLMTAYALFATFEESAFAKGQRGFVNIVKSLPWNDASFTGIVLAMILFIFGGFGGIVNASYSIDRVVHNTMWVVGHFHITVGGPVALTFLAISYRLIPALTGRALWSENWAKAQVWLWFIGMSVMSLAMHIQGLLGAPRRVSDIAYYGSSEAAAWHPWALLTAGGGIVLMLSVVAFVVNIIGTLRNDERVGSETLFAETRANEAPPPMGLDRLKFWTVVAVALVIIAYAGPVMEHYQQHIYLAPGMRTW